MFIQDWELADASWECHLQSYSCTFSHALGQYESSTERYCLSWPARYCLISTKLKTVCFLDIVSLLKILWNNYNICLCVCVLSKLSQVLELNLALIIKYYGWQSVHISKTICWYLINNFILGYIITLHQMSTKYFKYWTVEWILSGLIQPHRFLQAL